MVRELAGGPAFEAIGLEFGSQDLILPRFHHLPLVLARTEGGMSDRYATTTLLPRTLTRGSAAFKKCCLPCALAPFWYQ